DEDEIVEALEFAKEKKLPVFVLGGGSNILVSDKGFDGLVIKIQNSKFKIQNYTIDCDAGCPLSKIVSESIKSGLAGLEWAIGVPGTVAGAVRGNAGCFGGEMSGLVKMVEAVDLESLSKNKFNKKECEFNYRDSIFKRNKKLLITKVVFELAKGNMEKSRQKISEISKVRKEKQPVGLACPGSFFKNPVVKDKKIIEEFEKDTGARIGDNKNIFKYTGWEEKIPAAYLIDRAGLKSKKIGGAMVSENNANFIVNTGGATAEDVIALAAVVKTRVRNKFGIQLQEEVQMMGF
ncbi:MAG: UDP-N-acetylmuramate dehydrogenase, partial [Candidatus Moranbacteria bacterium]|nr:UDP-N-acetylmuramate dehydrogenase [Candidatus Moranbacteria bacterium]